MHFIVSILGQFFDVEFRTAMYKILTAVFCGLIVGVERTFRGKPAGIRTNVLISLGACLFMILSEYVATEALRLGFSNPDPARIAAQVVSGIGFLGAGAILINRGIVTGLTSAASIWVIAAIGLTAGAGLYKLAFTCAFLVAIVIETFRILVKKIRRLRFRYYELEVVMANKAAIQDIRKELRAREIIFSQESANKVLGETHYRALLYFRGERRKNIEKDIKKIPGVFQVIMLTTNID